MKALRLGLERIPIGWARVDPRIRTRQRTLSRKASKASLKPIACGRKTTHRPLRLIKLGFNAVIQPSCRHAVPHLVSLRHDAWSDYTSCTS